MGYRWLFIGCTLLSVMAVECIAQGFTLEFIGDKKVKSLQSIFKNAKPLVVRDQAQWQCKLYGMRSRIKVTNKSEFYHFTTKNRVPTSTGETSNSGAQIIKHYKQTSTGLIGVNGPFKDIVKMTSKGTLIAELSIPKKDSVAKERDIISQADKERVVITYATCIPQI